MQQRYWRGVAVVAASVYVVVVLAGCSPGHSGTAAVSARPSVSPVMTATGRLLWEFEGLMYSRFGKGSGQSWCIDTTKPKVGGYVVAEWFTAGDQCQFLDTHQGFWPMFSPHTQTTLRLVSKPWRLDPHMDFGNYPTQVLVDGHAVTCSSPKGSYLIRYRDADSVAFGCVAPQRIP